MFLLNETLNDPSESVNPNNHEFVKLGNILLSIYSFGSPNSELFTHEYIFNFFTVFC